MKRNSIILIVVIAVGFFGVSSSAQALASTANQIQTPYSSVPGSPVTGLITLTGPISIITNGPGIACYLMRSANGTNVTLYNVDAGLANLQGPVNVVGYWYAAPADTLLNSIPPCSANGFFVVSYSWVTASISP